MNLVFARNTSKFWKLILSPFYLKHSQVMSTFYILSSQCRFSFVSTVGPLIMYVKEQACGEMYCGQWRKKWVTLLKKILLDICKKNWVKIIRLEKDHMAYIHICQFYYIVFLNLEVWCYCDIYCSLQSWHLPYHTYTIIFLLLTLLTKYWALYFHYLLLQILFTDCFEIERQVNWYII